MAESKNQKGKRKDAAIRAAVVAALLAGESVTKVATDHQLDKSVVSRWKKQIPTAELQQVATEKKKALVDLIEEHLAASVAGGTYIANQTRDDAWRSRQSAADLAILYGVLSDKVVRLLEAARRLREIEVPAPKQLS